MSSLTNFLKLFKWDTKTDGSQKFDIDKALNGNWDKTDEAIENLQKTTISTSVSEEITVTDCAKVNAKLDIKNGKTIQNGTPTPETPIEIRNVEDNINIYITNKNILKHYNKPGYTVTLNGITFTINDDYSVTINGTATANTYFNFASTSTGYVEEGEYYSISSITKDSNINIVLRKSSENISVCNIGYSNFGTGKASFTGSVYAYIYVKSGAIINNLIYYPMLLKGKYTSSTVGSYIIPQSQNITFPLAEGQVLHNGDYLADDGIHQMRKILILNGTENWVFSGNNWVYFDVNDIIAESGLTNSFCNIAKEKTSSDAYSSSEFCFATTNTKKIAFKCMGYNSLEAWKSYLAEEYANGIPVTIEYELAEEIVTPYTTEQEKAYYQLKHLLMYEGYTNISCVNEIKPDIQLTYYYNNLLNKSYAKRFDELEEKIRNLQVGG